MKVPPKRKGNRLPLSCVCPLYGGLNESPSQKEGKSTASASKETFLKSLNESPSQKEGKSGMHLGNVEVAITPQ